MSTLVVGLGNRDRGDDAVGLVVAEMLLDRGVSAEVLAWERPEIDLLDVWHRHDRVVIIDATRSGSPGGVTRRVRGRGPGSPTRGRGATHGLDLGAVIELADALGRLPQHLDVRLVEAGSCDHGHGLSPEVAMAALRLVEELSSDLGDGGRRVPR